MKARRARDPEPSQPPPEPLAIPTAPPVNAAELDALLAGLRFTPPTTVDDCAAMLARVRATFPAAPTIEVVIRGEFVEIIVGKVERRLPIG